jgi:hypothetical protein
MGLEAGEGGQKENDQSGPPLKILPKGERKHYTTLRVNGGSLFWE